MWTEIVCKLIRIVKHSICNYINVSNATLAIISILKMLVLKAKHLLEIPIVQNIIVKMYVYNAQKEPSSLQEVIALLLTLLVWLIINQLDSASLVTLDTKFHKEHVSYQLLVPILTHTAQNGRVNYVSNVPREAISTKTEYVLLLILIVRNLSKDFVFLAMMGIHYRPILVLNHRYNRLQILYAPNGKAKYASNVQLVPSSDLMVNVLLLIHFAWPSIKLADFAWVVIKDTILITAYVMLPSKQVQLILIARNSWLRIYAVNVLIDTILDQMDSAKKLILFVILIKHQQEYVLLASPDSL